MRKLFVDLLLFVVAAFAAQSALGVDKVRLQIFEDIISDWRVGTFVDIAGSAAVPVDIRHDGVGRLGVYKASGDINFQSARGRHTLNFGVGYTQTYYDFDGENSPFSDANMLRFNTLYSVKVGGEGWSVFTLASGSLGAESAGDLLSGGRIMAGVGAGYEFSENLRLGLGACAYSRLDNTWIPLPIAYLEWSINKNLSLRVFGGATLVWDVFADKSLIVNFGGEYKADYYRLTDSPEFSERSFGDFYYQVSLSAIYNITEKVYVSAGVAGNIGREIIFRQNGASAEEIWVDASPEFNLHFGVRF